MCAQCMKPQSPWDILVAKELLKVRVSVLRKREEFTLQGVVANRVPDQEREKKDRTGSDAADLDHRRMDLER